MPPKKFLDDQLSFPMKATEKAALRKIAEAKGMTLANLMRVIVTGYLAAQVTQSAPLQPETTQSDPKDSGDPVLRFIV
jgi:hypothetical protein